MPATPAQGAAAQGMKDPTPDCILSTWQLLEAAKLIAFPPVPPPRIRAIASCRTPARPVATSTSCSSSPTWSTPAADPAAGPGRRDGHHRVCLPIDVQRPLVCVFRRTDPVPAWPELACRMQHGYQNAFIGTRSVISFSLPCSEWKASYLAMFNLQNSSSSCEVSRGE